jgi:nucleotide-binding universal stress UspA family protein
MKILLAVDGSKNSLHAVDHLIRHARWYRSKPSVELVTVHLPLPRLPNMGMVVGKGQVERYYREEGEARLARAKKKLAAAKISCRAAAA